MIRKMLRSSLAGFGLMMSSLLVAAAPDPAESPIEHAQLLGALQLEGDLFHVQGLELDRRRIWVTSVDRERRKAYIHEFDRSSGALLRRRELTDGARYHPGGISLSGGAIWVPVAEMKAKSSAVLVELDADSLAIRRKIHVPDHLGCVAASGSTLVAGNWDSKLLYVIDLSGAAPTRTVPNPSATSYQDMKFLDGQLVAGGTRSLWSGTVDWIDWPSMKLVRSLKAGAVGPIRPLGRGGPYTGEGMAIQGRDLYVVPEDGPSRMFHFRIGNRDGR